MFITPDLDKQERLKNTEVREELWRRRKDGEENLIIHKGKIVDKKKPIELNYRRNQGQTWAVTEETKVKLKLLQRRPMSNLGFKIDYCAQSGSNKNRNNNYKTNKRERKNKCSNIEKISCLYLNARSVINKWDELELYIIANKPSIIGVTESWTNCDSRDSELNLKGYECLRKDRDIKNEKGKDKKGLVF